MEERFLSKRKTENQRRERARSSLDGSELIPYGLVETLIDVSPQSVGKMKPILEYEGEGYIILPDRNESLPEEEKILLYGTFSIVKTEDCWADGEFPVAVAVFCQLMDGEAGWGGRQKSFLDSMGYAPGDICFRIYFEPFEIPNSFSYRVSDVWDYCEWVGLPDPSAEIVDHLQGIREPPSSEGEEGMLDVQTNSSANPVNLTIEQDKKLANSVPPNQVGIRIKNAQKAMAKAFVRGIAKAHWKADTDEAIRIADMSAIVWAELVEMEEEEIMDVLPDDETGLKAWLREGDPPEYARKPGAKKK